MPSTEAPAAPRDRRRTDTRARIVDAAMQLFNSQGYTGTTVAQIERAVGLRPGSGGLYRHFASKDDLLFEAVRAYGDRVRALRAELAARNAITDASDLAADLRHLVSCLATFLAGEGPVIRLSLSGTGLPDAARDAIADAWEDGYGMMIDLLAHHGVPEDEAAAAGVAALGGLDHYFSHLSTWHRAPGGVAPDRFLEAWVAQWSRLADR